MFYLHLVPTRNNGLHNTLFHQISPPLNLAPLNVRPFNFREIRNNRKLMEDKKLLRSS